MVSKIENIRAGLDMLIEDSSVPRNIRTGAQDIKEMLGDESEPLDVRKARSLNILDDMANDSNIPLHGRTLVWNIMSQFETLS